MRKTATDAPGLPAGMAVPGALHAAPSKTPRNAPSWLVPVLQFLAVAVFWGGSWIAIKAELRMVPPGWSVTYRFLIAGGAILGWCLLRGQPIRMPRHALPFLFLIGLVQFTLDFNLLYGAELYVPSAVPAVAFAVLMVPNAILARVFLKQRVRRGFATGSLLGILGIALLFYQQLAASTNRDTTILGILLVVGAVLASSVANVMQGSRRATSFPPLAGLGWSMLIGAVLDGGLSFATVGPPSFDPAPSYTIALLYLGLLAGAVAFSCYFDLIRRIGPANAAWVNVVIPILAVAISTMVEDFHLTAFSIGGALLAIGGLAIALGAGRPRAPGA